MSLPDLLKLCKDSPSRKREAWQYIKSNAEYIKATARTQALAWVVNGKLDICRTEEYIYLMGDPLAEKQTPIRSKNERLISLPEALGIETRPYGVM